MAKKVLVLTNSINGLYSFRKELIEALLKERYEVNISAPNDRRSSYFKEIGCNLIDTPIERRSANPIADFALFAKYLGIIKQSKPDVVLTYTIKPNVYGGLACWFLGIPYIATITGLGSAVENEGLLRKISLFLYKKGLKKATRVFFQNRANLYLFLDHGITSADKATLIPGSGVNLEVHCFEDYPAEEKPLRFLYLGRIMRDKGINELLKAAEIVKSSYPNVEFHLIGDLEEDYWNEINVLQRNGIIQYHGHQENVHFFLKNSHAIINPSYHEGMSNVLLEAAATGRPILASKIPGCMETFEEGFSGFGFEAKNVESLVDSIIRFIKIPYEDKKKMGLASREKMEKEFDRKYVNNAYLEEIKQIMERK